LGSFFVIRLLIDLLTFLAEVRPATSPPDLSFLVLPDLGRTQTWLNEKSGNMIAPAIKCLNAALVY